MRALRILLILAVVLGGIFVAADRFAVNFAEDEAAGKIRSSQGLGAQPEVSIKGFPFLTQVLSSSLDEVDVSLDGITASADGHAVQVTEVRAELRDVRIDSSFSSATAGRATGSARISYADLAKSAPKGATVSYAGPERAGRGEVKVSGPLKEVLEGAGIEVPEVFQGALKGRTFTTYSKVSIEGGDTVRLRSESLPALPLPGLKDKMREVVDYDLKIDGLPSTIALNTVTASEDGLRFSGTGTGVSLTG
ncbi:DUF2993 domain-containing protein [Streptomyces sp. A3M-1-3]|uniref:LmeA family phospholipid-binding protein n=1 Tax=Streptomyces sp. A3M-1-3 TaxID=2962044 RepID=UPI0020B7B66E|nr:DUF2993 domain-containing protein [Streptomyces sp. A3M-1-3]MCP3821057.1 DUF2993 domain-containing protein [Streptomyces sp. A3M-1-3]